MTRRSTTPLVPALLALLLTTVVPANADPERVLAIGDIHGAYRPLVDILRAAGLIDRQERWIGADATFVQVGDFLDRGADVIEVMDLLMRLQEEAPRHGGRVIVLLGNHEIMNLLGVLRDVSPEVYERLAGPGAAARQEELYQAAAELQRSRDRRGELPPDFEARWKARHPPGSIEYWEAIGPRGKYGRWLRGLPSAVRVGDTFFMHAGMSPETGRVDAEALSAWVQEDVELYDAYRDLLARHGLIVPGATYKELLETADELAGGGLALASLSEAKSEVKRASRDLLVRTEDWVLTDVYGPLWFRGFAKWDRGEGARNTRTLARTLGVEHFVVGHSPVRDRSIHHRFDGTVFLIDTGMLSEHYRGGRPSILERRGESWTAIYLDGREVLLGPGPRQALARPWRGPDGGELPFSSDAEALDFLKTADVVSKKPLDGGSSQTLKVLLEKDGVRVHAAFRTVELRKQRVTLGREVFLDFHDSFRYEVAAYELARLLGLDQIPPVVERQIEGERGSLQLWVEGATTESERHREKAQPPDRMAWYRQLQVMRIFDRLIYNYDRNRGNILIGDDWKLWMIDHTRSFRISADVPEIRTVTHCEKDLWRRLREVGEDELEERLSAYMSRKQVRALVKRRDKIVEYVEELIAEHGEEHVLFDLDEVPSPEESFLLAGRGIESFLDGLPNESEVPAELRRVTASE